MLFRSSRAAAVNQRPQWNGSGPGTASCGSAATAAPSRPMRLDSSAARRRCPSAAMAAWVPNGCPCAGVVTRTRGAGRSGIGTRDRVVAQPVELLEVLQVVDADEQQPLPAAQVADQRVLHPAALGLVAVEPLRSLADGAPRLVEQRQELVECRLGSTGH